MNCSSFLQNFKVYRTAALRNPSADEIGEFLLLLDSRIYIHLIHHQTKQKKKIKIQNDRRTIEKTRYTEYVCIYRFLAFHQFPTEIGLSLSLSAIPNGDLDLCSELISPSTGRTSGC